VVLTAVNINVTAFWDVTPYTLVNIYDIHETALSASLNTVIFKE
jgi:hypothetical protein